MRRPNLIIPGSAKSGTSSLHNYLVQHKKIYGKIKEPHTYSFDERYANRLSEASETSFKQLYGAASEQYLIDASTSYLVAPNAVERIVKDSPEAKFIVLLRDPLERIESHYNWLSTKKTPLKSFNKEILSSLDSPFDPEINFKGNYKNYLTYSRYGAQMKELLKYVDRANLLVLYTDDLKNEPNVVLEKIWHFLGLESPEQIDTRRKNETKQDAVIKKRPFKRLIPYVSWISKSLGINKVLKERLKYYKRAKRITLDVKQKQWLYGLLKEDLELLDQLGYLNEQWQYVNDGKS